MRCTVNISSRIHRPKPHFPLLVSFDEDDKSNNVLDNGNPICPSNHYFEIFAAQYNQTLHQIHWNENKHSTIPSLISKKKSVGMPLSFQIIEQTYECIQDIDGKAIQTTTIMKNMNSSQSKKNHFPLFHRISKTSSDDW